MELIKKGDKFEVIETITRHALTHWCGLPYTGDVTCILPKGTILVTGPDAVASARGFGCGPVDYCRLQRVLIPWKVRWNPLFAGYTLVFLKEDIGRLLRRV